MPGLFTSSPAVVATMAAAAPALGFALITYVLSSACEGMLVARKQLRFLACAHVANTLGLSLGLRAALRVGGCGLQHVWWLFGLANVLRIFEFATGLHLEDRAAMRPDSEPRRLRRVMRRMRERVAARRAQQKEMVHEQIPDVADIAGHLL